MGLPKPQLYSTAPEAESTSSEGRSETVMASDYVSILDRADAHFAKVLAEQPAAMQCRQGCTGCCHGLFEIGTADVSMIQEAMRILDEPARERLKSRARAIFESTLHPTLRDCSPEEKEAFFERADEIPCPALDDAGACSIYEYRPIVCRTFGLPLREGRKYLGQECELNFIGVKKAVKESVAWDLEWEDVLGPEDEFTIPEAIILATMFD